MIDNESKKLIILLRNRSKEFESFIDLIKQNKVPPNTVSYLYNYLYKLGINIKIEGITYDKDRVIIRESKDNNSIKTYKYNVIDIIDKLSDFKRTVVAIKLNKNKDEIKVKKEVHYALKNNVDIMILETDEKDSLNTSFDNIISSLLKNNDYKKMSFIILKDPSLKIYETTELKKGKADTYKTVLVDDELIDYNNIESKDLKKTQNDSLSAKQSMKYLRKLGEEKKGIINSIDLKDADLVSFIEKMKNENLNR